MTNAKDFEFALSEDKELGIGQHKWYGKEDQTDEKLMHDIGKGEQVVIRLFEFELKPGLEKNPTEDEILTPEYMKHLQTLLWGDALRLVMKPRVNIKDGKLRIFAPCQATTGNSFLEESKLLQEYL